MVLSQGGVGFKIWMVLEMDSVPKLLHSHLPNQVIEPLPRITLHFSKTSTLTLLLTQILLQNKISKFYPSYSSILLNYNHTSYNQYVIRISPLIPSICVVNLFVNKSILLRLKPLTEPFRAIYTIPLIPLKNTTNIM